MTRDGTRHLMAHSTFWSASLQKLRRRRAGLTKELDPDDL